MFKIYLLIFILSFCKISYSQVEWSYSIQPTVVKNRFSWDIAGNTLGNNPNILSELIWKDIIHIGMATQIRIKLKEKFTFDFKYDISNTINGKVRDIDYSEDNKTGILENETYNSDKGNFKSYNINLGYIINKKWGDLNIFLNGIYEKNTYLLLAPIKSLNSSYQPKSFGGGIGITTKLHLNHDFELNISNIYSLNKYIAIANWNLRTDFSHPISFKHTATTYKVYGEYGINYKLKKQIHITPYIAYSKYTNLGDALDKLFYSNGDISFTKLNNVKSISREAGVKFIYII